MVTKAMLQQENDGLRQRVAELETQLATCTDGRVLSSLPGVTERKQAEEKLRESESRYRKLFENMNNGVAVYEVVDEGRDFIIKDFNRAGEKIDHERREHLIGRSIFEVRPGIEEFGLLETMRQVWKSGQPVFLPATHYKDERLDAWYENFIYRISPNEIVTIFENITERKQAEDKLRESERRFTTLFRSSPIPAGITRADDYCIVDVNEAWIKLTGYTREEAIGHTSTELGLAKPETLQKVRGILDAQPAISENEIFLYTRSGQERQMLISAETIELGGEKYFLTNLQDITARKQTEQNLRRSEMLLKEMGKIAQIGAWELDIATMQQRWTDETYAIHDRERGEYDPNASEELSRFEPGSQERIGAAFDEALMQGKPYDLEVEMTTVKGNRKWVRAVCSPLLVDGKVTKLAGTLQDITNRKQAEDERAKLTERLDLAARSAGIGIWDWDILKNEIVWDDQMYALYGFEPGEFGGAYEAWLRGVHPDDRESSNAVSAAAVRGEREYDTEFRVLWRDGSMHWLKANGEVFRDCEGKPTRMVGVNYDITDRKQAEEKLRASEEKWHNLFEILPIGISIVSPENVVIETNPALTKILDMPQEGLANGEFRSRRYFRSDKTLMPAEEFPSLRALREQKTIRDVEIGIEKENGERIWTSVSAIPLAVLDNTVTVTVDITERKQAEDKLRKNEERQALLLKLVMRIK